MARPAYIKAKAEVSGDIPEGSELEKLALSFRAARDKKEELEEELKEVNKEIDDVSGRLAEVMEAQGVDSFKRAGIGTIYIEIKNRPSIVDKDGFIRWLDDTGRGEMARRAVHPMSLESLVKEMLEEGATLPESLNNFQQRRARLRRK